MTQPIAYLNGHFVSEHEARIPATDAGFVLGITISEQLRTFRGKLFRMDDHWRRLARSLDIVGTTPVDSLAELSFAAEQVAKHNSTLLLPGDDLGLVIAITPGSFGSFARSANDGPLTIIHSYPLPFSRWAKTISTGLALRIAPNRQIPTDCWPAELKCRSRMHYHLADRWAEAQEPGARALLLDSEGMVNETSAANIAIISKNRLIHPPREKILPGVSLQVTKELATARGYICEERPIDPSELFTADEIVATSTTFCILPVTTVDGKQIGMGKPGSFFGEMSAAWSELTGVNLAAQAQRALLFVKR
jgi:branched-chain amino acid aminotransferase